MTDSAEKAPGTSDHESAPPPPVESDSSSEERARSRRKLRRKHKSARKVAKREQPAATISNSVWRLTLLPMSTDERQALVRRLLK